MTPWCHKTFKLYIDKLEYSCRLHWYSIEKFVKKSHKKNIYFTNSKHVHEVRFILTHAFSIFNMS